MTNKGLRMEAHRYPSIDPSSASKHPIDDIFCVELNCKLPYRVWDERRLAIMVRGVQGDQYARISTGEFIRIPFISTWNSSQALFHDRIPSQSLNTPRSVFHVKQRDDGDSPFRGPYTFNIPIASLIENGLFVSQKRLSNKYRSHWETELVGEERLKTSTLGPGGMAAVLMFATTREVLGDLSVVDAFALVLTVYDHRARIRIIAPGSGEWDTWVKSTNLTFDGCGGRGKFTLKSRWSGPSGNPPSLTYHKRGNSGGDI
jgi:hypothetical protein